MSDRANKYSAGLVSESPWFLEFRKVISLLDEGVSEDELKALCLKQNFFGMASENRVNQIYRYIIKRCRVMDQGFIRLFTRADLMTQKLINFITVILNDKLFLEFVVEVYREKVFLGYTELLLSDINTFFTDKTAQCSDMKGWTDETLKRLRTGYCLFMVNAGLLQKEGNQYKITPPVLDWALEEYLQRRNLTYIANAFMGVR